MMISLFNSVSGSELKLLIVVVVKVLIFKSFVDGLIVFLEVNRMFVMVVVILDNF